MNEIPSLTLLDILSGISWSISADPNSDKYIKDHDTTYKINLNGHRGPEFSSGIDTLIVGCSVTYGTGLELEETWGYLLTQRLGHSYNLLAFPGGSISKLVRQTIEWINLYGKPKRILALMPDVGRIDFYQPNQKQHDNLMIVNEKQVYEKIKKQVLIYENVMTNKLVKDVDYPSLMSFAALNTLEKICSILDIDLIWSSWHMNEKLSMFSKYFELPTKGNNLEDCTNHPPVGKNFYIASDNSHWGSHYHIHVADNFYDQLNKEKA